MMFSVRKLYCMNKEDCLSTIISPQGTIHILSSCVALKTHAIVESHSFIRVYFSVCSEEIEICMKDWTTVYEQIDDPRSSQSENTAKLC